MTIAKNPTITHREPIDPIVLERAARVIKVLGHPLRLRIVEALENGERPVVELQAATGASQAAVSQQLGILRSCGVVDARRNGMRVYYWITEPRVIKILDCIRECDLPELAEIGTLVPLGDLASIGRLSIPTRRSGHARVGRPSAGDRALAGGPSPEPTRR